MSKYVANLLLKSVILSPFDKAMLTAEAEGEMRTLERLLGDRAKDNLVYPVLEEFVARMRSDGAVDALMDRVGKMRGGEHDSH